MAETTWPAKPKTLAAAAAAGTSLQPCTTLCGPTDGSPPGSLVPGILQARTLERVAISFSSVWNWKVKVKSLGRVRLLATPWTVAYQAPPSMGFSRQEYWSGVPLPSPYFILFNGWIIFHCRHVPRLLYPLLCWWTFELLSCLVCCKQCYEEHWVHLNTWSSIVPTVLHQTDSPCW